jgi:hypothetical protein
VLRSSDHQTTTGPAVTTSDLVSPSALRDDVTMTDVDVGDRDALRGTADWITTFVATPNDGLGRPGPVCPFVPGGLQREVLWMAVEHIASLSLLDVVALVRRYTELFIRMEPLAGEDAEYKAFVVVLPDLSADQAGEFFDELLEQLQVSSYVDHGLVLGAFHERNEGTAVHNPHFRPFRSPVPFLLIRRAVLGDWKFFLDDDESLSRWAQRFGVDAVHALAAELRELPWRTGRGQLA